MPIPVDSTVQQVYARLAETIGSPFAETADTTGGGASITADAQILAYLNEGQQFLAQVPAFGIWGSAQGMITGGTTSTPYASLTPTVVGQRMWRVGIAKWGTTPLDICDPKYFAVHNQDITLGGSPERLYDDGDGFRLAPRPGTNASVLLEGWMLPVPGVAGGSFSDLRAELSPVLIAYAAWKCCVALVEEPKFAAALKLFESEWKSSAGVK